MPKIVVLDNNYLKLTINSLMDKFFNGQQLKKAAPGFEPGVEILQTSALPLGYAAVSSVF